MRRRAMSQHNVIIFFDSNLKYIKIQKLLLLEDLQSFAHPQFFSMIAFFL